MSRRRKKQKQQKLVATNVDQAYLLYMQMHDNNAPTASRFKKFINEDKNVKMAEIDFVTADRYLRTSGKGRKQSGLSSQPVSTPRRKKKNKRHARADSVSQPSTNTASAPKKKKKKKNKHYRQTRSLDYKDNFDFTKIANDKSRDEVQLPSIASFSSLKPSKALKHSKRKKQKRVAKDSSKNQSRKSKKSRKALPTIKAQRINHETVQLPPEAELSALMEDVLIASPASSPKHAARKSPKRSSPQIPTTPNGSNAVLKAFPFIEHMTVRQAQEMEIMHKIDHRYKNGMYLAAQVVQKNGTKYKIRYGNNRNNEIWSDYKHEIYRFAKQHSITLRPAHRMLDIDIGSGVDINIKRFKKKGKSKGWRKGVLSKKDYKSGQVQIEYVSRGRKYTYWTHLDNDKEIAPYKSMTEAHRRKKHDGEIKKQEETRKEVKKTGHKTKKAKHAEAKEFTFDLNVSISEQMQAYTADAQLIESNEVDSAYNVPSMNGKTSMEPKAFDMNMSIAEQMGINTTNGSGSGSPQKERNQFDMNVSISEQMKAYSSNKALSPQKEYTDFDIKQPISQQMNAYKTHTQKKEVDLNASIKNTNKSSSPQKEHSPQKTRSPQKEYNDVDLNITTSERMKKYTEELGLKNTMKETKEKQSAKRKKKEKQKVIELNFMNVEEWKNEEVLYWFNTMENAHFGKDNKYETLKGGLKRWNIKGNELWQINDIFLKMLSVNEEKDRTLIIENIQKTAPKPLMKNARSKKHRRQFTEVDLEIGIKKATQQYTKENEMLHGEISRLEIANSKIASDHTQKVSQLTDLQQMYDKVMNQNKKPSKALSQARQQNQDLNAQLRQLTVRLKQQEQDIESRNDEVAKMKKKINTINKESHKKDKKMAALKSEKQKEAQEVIQLRKQLSMMTNKYEKLHIAFNKQKEEISDVTKDSYYETQHNMMNGNHIAAIDTTHDDIKDQPRKSTEFEGTPDSAISESTITGMDDYLEYEDTDEIRTIIVDNGSESIKLGYGQTNVSDSHRPSKKFHSIIGRPKQGNTYANEYEVLVGDEAYNKSSILNTKHVLKRGNVTDWEMMERVWEYTFYKKLAIPESKQLSNHNVLLTESLLREKRDREKSVQIMFETFDTNAMFIENEASLSLYGVGKYTGTVLGVGYGVTYATAIYEGSCIPSSVVKIHAAGYDITTFLKSILSKRYSSILNSTKHYIMKNMKQKYCYVTDNFHASLKRKADSYKKYKLPDGQSIRIGNERFIACEQLFGGIMNLNGEDTKDHRSLFNHNAGIQHMVWTAMNALEGNDFKDIRQELYSTGVVLSGGSTLFKGLGNRLKNEMYKLSNQDIPVVAPEKRKYLAWIGGSLVSSLPNYRESFIQRSEYEEHGANIVHKKCA